MRRDSLGGQLLGRSSKPEARAKDPTQHFALGPSLALPAWMSRCHDNKSSRSINAFSTYASIPADLDFVRTHFAFCILGFAFFIAWFDAVAVGSGLNESKRVYSYGIDRRRSSYFDEPTCLRGLTHTCLRLSCLERVFMGNPRRLCQHSFTMLLLCSWSASYASDLFQVTPADISLNGNYARLQVVVTKLGDDGTNSSHSEDLTSSASFSSSDPAVFTVTATGELLAVRDGSAKLTVTTKDVSREIPVKISGVLEKPAIGFIEHISPILSKAGCNMGACHASQHGKGGFVLSVFGFEPDKDAAMMARDRDRRRVNLLEPEQSLILQKPTMRVAHGGGKRLSETDIDYQILVSWLKGGAPAPRAEAPQVTKLEVWPVQRLTERGAKQQLRVSASYSNGDVRDVTAWARYDSMDDGVLSVSRSGVVETVGEGQAPVMVRFEGQAAIAVFVVPFGPPPQLTGWNNQNFVDELAAQKFRELGIEPSPLCDDATFIRRAYLDCIGTMPTPEETVAFIESHDSAKRSQLVDRLLGLTGDPTLDRFNDKYAAYWTLKWSDLIRNTSDKLGEQGMWALHNWLRDSFRQNKPFDRFVRELVTGKGSIYSSGPANYFRINSNSSDLAESTSQIFLGIRLECAKCHHHPFEKYGQEHYYGFAAFFSRVALKRSEEFGLFGGEQVVYVQPTGDVRHPKTGKVLSPTTLEGTTSDHPLDRRIGLADWLTSGNNEFFAKSVVNRYVSYLLGRGLVEPVDDLRSTNPPSNVALMDALAQQFVASKFDVKQLIRTLMTSRLYQLDSTPNQNNAADQRFFSHFMVKRISAEPLLDAVDRVTNSPTKFQNLPRGTRAIELPDAEYPDYFLNTFAKPRRASVCECERSPDESLSQALHTLNGDVLANKIADGNGRIAQLLKELKLPDKVAVAAASPAGPTATAETGPATQASTEQAEQANREKVEQAAAEKKANEKIVSQIYLAALCRYPTAAETESAFKYLSQSPSPKEFYEDLLWALINSKQFLFVH
jgi:hypothetical protein